MDKITKASAEMEKLLEEWKETLRQSQETPDSYDFAVKRYVPLLGWLVRTFLPNQIKREEYIAILQQEHAAMKDSHKSIMERNRIAIESGFVSGEAASDMANESKRVLSSLTL